MTLRTGKAIRRGGALLIAVWLALPAVLALTAGCAGRDAIGEYRQANEECPPDDLKVPCKIGPDSKLYRY